MGARRRRPGATAQYNDVNCANTSDCWAVGNTSNGAPLIAATTNGGSTWKAQTPPSAVNCRAPGHLVREYDGVHRRRRRAWDDLDDHRHKQRRLDVDVADPPTGVSTLLNDVDCPSATVCFAVGGTSSASTVIASTNGGSAWAAQTVPASDNVALNSIACPSTTVCFAVGNAITGTGEIVGTTDGGTNWSYQSDGTSQTLYDVSCWDTTDCVAVGVSGRIVGSSNGTGWSWQTSPTSATLYNVDVSNETAGTIVGASGTILGYSQGCNTGGLSFTPPSTLSWPSTALTGRDQAITTPLTLSPDDETGSGAGWNLTATSTTFTSGARTLPTTAAQISAGSASSASGTCSVPVNQIAYPVTIPAGTTPARRGEGLQRLVGYGRRACDGCAHRETERPGQHPERHLHLDLDADARKRTLGERNAFEPGLPWEGGSRSLR